MLGIRWWIWLVLFVVCFLGGLITLLIIFRKRIKEFWLKKWYPNHVYKIIIFYGGNRYKTFWEKVGVKNDFNINQRTYRMEEGSIQKEFKGFPTLMFYENSPTPIIPDVAKHKIKMSSYDLNAFKNEDLISKLLTVDIGEKLIKLILIIVICNALGTAFLIAQALGVMV